MVLTEREAWCTGRSGRIADVIWLHLGFDFFARATHTQGNAQSFDARGIAQVIRALRVARERAVRRGGMIDLDRRRNEGRQREQRADLVEVELLMRVVPARDIRQAIPERIAEQLGLL